MRKVVCAAVVLFLTLECISLATSDSAFITNGGCKQTEVFLRQKNISISADCDCPPNFIALISEEKKPTFCIMLTKPQIWSNICISTGTTDDYYEVTVKERAAINSFLRKINVTKFWISVQRDSTYDPPLKKLPGSKWGLPLDFDEDYDLEISKSSSGNCLMASIDRNYTTASFEDCNKNYPQLCVYKKSTMLRLYCPFDAYTSRYSDFQDYCFNIVKVPHDYWNTHSLFDVDSHRKFQLYQKLASESDIKCESTIVQSNLTYHIQQAILNAGQNHENILYYAAMRSDGTMALTKDFDCIAYQNRSNSFYSKTPELKLNFDRIHKKLLLVISNWRYLWRENIKDVGVVCYTDGDTELLKAVGIKRKVWPPQNNREDDGDYNDMQEIYELKLYGDFPGYYWCEGHSVVNFTLIKSDRITAQKKESDVHIYSILLEVSNLEQENFWQKNNLKRLIKDYSQYLKSYGSDHISRIAGMLKGMQVMKIEHIDPILQKTSIVVHVAARYNNNTIFVYSEIIDSICPGCEESVKEHYRLKQVLAFLFETTSNEKYHFKGINSTDMCLPQDTYGDLKWPAARIGQTIAPQELCLIEASGLPLTRKCVGDRTYGGVWQQFKTYLPCSKTVKKHTMQLFNYADIPVNVAEMAHVMHEMEHVMDSAIDLIPADLFYISKTMDNLRSALLNNGSNNVALIENNREKYYCDIAGILNRVMYMNDSVVLRSQVALNTTNILLDSTDDIINQLSVANSSIDFLRGDSLNCVDKEGQPLDTESVLENQRGTLLLKTSRLILLVVDPFVSGISGLAITKVNGAYEDNNSTDQSSFELYETRLISADELESNVIMEENLEIAAYVPTELLEKISLLNEHIGEENDTSEHVLRIVISVYFNDNVFKETTNGTILRANGKIISITIPGYSSDLPGEIPIFIKDHDRNQSSSCGYWNFEPEDIDMMPKWSFGGCKPAAQYEGITLCKCSHLTPFSRLCMDIQHIESEGVLQKFIGESNIFTLDIITSIGSALSLLGVLGIFVTAFLFPTWRQTAHSKILLQLSLAISFELVIIFLDGPDINYKEQKGKIQCTLLGGSFHYIILVTFMWMLVIAYLQFLRYVKVLGRLRPSRFILKASLLSWGLPLVPVIVFATVDYTLYHKQDNISDICYPHGVALYYGLLLPIAVIILVNMASFVLIIYNVFSVPNNLTRSSERDLTLSQVRLSVFLFFLLGLPWIFGMMVTIGAGKIFSYLFCITAPLQGFILFVYFIIMNPLARKFWCSKCSKSEAAKDTIDIPVK